MDGIMWYHGWKFSLTDKSTQQQIRRMKEMAVKRK
jgi:hypothetical protein